MNLRSALITAAAALAIACMPLSALADGTAAIVAVYPSDANVGVGTSVTFIVQAAGFSNPSFKVVDSFGGGVSNANIDSYGNFNWTPNNSDIGAHTITVTVSDSSGNSASASQTFNVSVPSVSISAITPGATVRFGNQVSFSTASNGFISPQYTISDSFPYSTVTIINTDSLGSFHWTPIYQDIGVHTLTVTARDYAGHFATATAQITVTGPAFMSLGPVTPATIHAGDVVAFTATTTGFTAPVFTVSDGFTSSLGTSTLAIDANGKVTWTPNSNDIGTHPITVSVSDAAGNTGSMLINVQVVQGSTTPFSAAPVPYQASAATTTRLSSAITTPTPNYIFKALLSLGSRGADVTALQQLLVTLGFLSAEPTGYFGTLTRAALQKYQTAHGISPVGYAGPATRASLSLGK